MKKITLLIFTVLSLYSVQARSMKTIWIVGTRDGRSSEFALSPDRYEDFIREDFGYEDTFFIPEYSSPSADFPYVLPGPVDTWGGTWNTAGWRTHEVNILFSLKKQPAGNENFSLRVDLADFSKAFLPLVKLRVNNQVKKFQLDVPGHDVSMQPKARMDEPLADREKLVADAENATPASLVLELKGSDLKKNGNVVHITVLEGSWIKFDCVSLEGSCGLSLAPVDRLYLREVKAEDYELESDGARYQALLVDVEHLSGEPSLSVELDGKVILSKTLEKGRYCLEAPMPAVDKTVKSRYKIKADGRVIDAGQVVRKPCEKITLADYVDTRIGTAHSRWMIGPGPWMPFSMVKMSPDNQNAGWQAGYQPSFENIACFSHIHEWTLGGLGLMAANGELKTVPGDEQKPDEGYRSRIGKRTEYAGIGLYSAELTDYGIKAEVSATTRCGFTRFTFPKDRGTGRVMIEFHPQTEYDFYIKDIEVRKLSDTRIEGCVHQYSPNVWSDDAEQDYRIHFVLEFDRPFTSLGYWCDDELKFDVDALTHGGCREAGMFAEFDVSGEQVVNIRSAISPVCIENAAENLQQEIAVPFGWDLDAVVRNQKDVWNDIFNRVTVSTDNRLEKVRFYNNMYRAVCSRNIWSDCNGEWVSTDGQRRKVASPENDVMIGCDAFWNTFWNLNQFWNLVTPEWSGKWVRSQLEMYKADGFLAKGPAGLNYIPVMVAEHEIPMIAGAYQMGIRDFDAELALEAMVKMQTVPARKVFKGFAGNRDLVPYMQYGYVPYDLGRFSNTMEYSFDDWTVGQFAKSLGRNDLYEQFNERGYWWKNVISEDGYCRMKDSKGEWVASFDPFRSGANHHYVEGNAWQLTFFVPQDIPALVEKIGRERFCDRLLWGFNQDEVYRYNAPNDQYWDHPVVQGNQQSMHFAYLFNWAGQPWNTQKWSRSILDRYYGCGVANAYLGDEDQGQMSAWAVMTSIGLFQTDGGTSAVPVYELASPAFEKIVIDLGGKYGRGDRFVINAKNASRKNIYVQSAYLNGEKLESFRFSASELLKGGELSLEMGPEPAYKLFGKF